MGLGYVDTAHGPQDLNNPDFGALTKLSNQYAAMPSLHVGWSLWCGVVIALVAPYLWMKILGMLYPLLTVAVIVGTANHYVLDAVGGAAVVAAGFGLQYVLLGVGRKPSEAANGSVTEMLSAGARGVRERTRALVRRPRAGEPGETSQVAGVPQEREDAEPADASR